MNRELTKHDPPLRYKGINVISVKEIRKKDPAIKLCEWLSSEADHLGNVRVAFADTNSDGNADILQETHYYPFGLEIVGLNQVFTSVEDRNKFSYNGKELEDEHGLHWYHYGARYYDPQLGRWHSVDPADEFLAPFVYVGNNPGFFEDPDGTWSDPEETPDNGGVPDLPRKFIEIGQDIANSFQRSARFAAEDFARSPSILVDRSLDIGFSLAANTSKLWESGLVRSAFPQDDIYVGFNVNGVAGLGFNGDVTFHFVTRGPDSRLMPYITLTPSVRGGFDPSISVFVGSGTFIGPSSEISYQSLQGFDVAGDFGFGAGLFLGIGGNAAFQSGDITWFNKHVSLGGAPWVSGKGSAGAGYSIVFDPKK